MSADAETGDSFDAESAEEIDQGASSLFGTQMDPAESAEEAEAEGSAEAGSFVKKFAESLDVTPLPKK